MKNKVVTMVVLFVVVIVYVLFTNPFDYSSVSTPQVAVPRELDIQQDVANTTMETGGTEDIIDTMQTSDTDSAKQVAESEGDTLGKMDQTESSTKTPAIPSSRYLSYTPELFASLSGTKRIYFFHAEWDKTCQSLDEEFTVDQDNIPGDVTLFRTNYDHESGLKKSYNITDHHTFLYVDSKGDTISTWSGGGISELVRHTKSL